jgi:UDP-N-acetyl-D-glucosamine dehydrogenase
LGRVGLPTALCVLNENYEDIGIGTDENLINHIPSGISSLPELGFEALKKFQSNNLLKVSTSRELLSEANIIIVCVPAPLDSSTLTADLSYLKDALTEVSVLLTKQKLIIIESTIPPNTIRNILIPHLEEKSGKKVGKDFFD